MSFVDQDDVLDAISRRCSRRPGGHRCGVPPIERLTWHDAIDRFGVDKPDLRFGMELVELTELFAASGFKAFAGAGASRACGCRAARPAQPQGTGHVDRTGEEARRQGPGVDAGAGRRRLSRRWRSSSRRRSRPASSRPPGGEDDLLRSSPTPGNDLRGARPAAQRPRPTARAKGRPLCLGRRLPDVRRDRPGHRTAQARPPPVHPPAPGRHRQARVRPADRPPRPTTSSSRLGAGFGFDPDPRTGAAARCSPRSGSRRRRPTRGSASS